MTRSNRFVNRLLLAVLGLVLAATATGLILLGIGGPARAWFSETTDDYAPAATSRLTPPDGLTITGPDGFAVLWPLLAIAGVAVLIALVAFLLAIRHGGGRTATVLVEHRADDALAGSVTLSTGFVQSLLEGTLSERSDVLSVSVSAYRHRKTTALKVRVLPHAGVSPRTIVEAVRESVLALDDLLGMSLPVVLEIGSSPRAALGRTPRTR